MSFLLSNRQYSIKLSAENRKIKDYIYKNNYYFTFVIYDCFPKNYFQVKESAFTPINLLEQYYD